MSEEEPEPITPAEHRRRTRRAREIAQRLGFVGRVEYRHVFSSAGGAQYGLAATEAKDLLLVYAEAFDRDADPDDFSLEAILAHERGHQLLHRHPRLRKMVVGRASETSEEILASLVGSLVVASVEDAEALILKALGEALACGVEPPEATRIVTDLRSYLERIL